MGETHTPNNMRNAEGKGCHEQRRNGMWNIFEGIEPEMLDKLGLSPDVIDELCSVADDTDTICVRRKVQSACFDNTLVPPLSETSRFNRSVSVTLGEVGTWSCAMARRRRNALGNLFEILTPSQRLLFVEHLQIQFLPLHDRNVEHSDNKPTSSFLKTTPPQVSAPLTYSLTGTAQSHGQIACH